MSWSDSFIGIPYIEFGRDRNGCDCWGLTCAVYREVLTIELPDYLGYGSVDEHSEVAALIEGAVTSPLWSKVDGSAQPFDVAVFRRGTLSTHVGVVIQPGLMIHMEGEDCAKVVDYRIGRWKNRFIGHYRHFKGSSKDLQSDAVGAGR